tara:strand:+ start:334 stop:1149 length:816 start_codon:yes stop_codon:yes gene_type:complete
MIHNDKNVAITGSTGILGRHIVSLLHDAGYHVHAFKGDITCQDDVNAWLYTIDKIDSLVHLAACVSTKAVSHDPLHAYRVNVGGTLNLLHGLALSEHCPWMFYASSSHVYQSQDKPIDESGAVEPVSLYGKTKYMGEQICLDASETNNHGLTVCSGRIFSFYDPQQLPPFFYPTMVERLATEDLSQPFELWGADSTRDFLTAQQVCQYIIKLMEVRAQGVVNIASGKAVKIRDFVQSMSSVPLEIIPKGEDSHLLANIGKLTSLLHQEQLS